MYFKGTRAGVVTLNLYPIGNVIWSFDKKTRQLKNKLRILIRDVKILYDTELTITEETEEKILAMGKSDLFTDGTKFYTTFGTCIREIQHPKFSEVLADHIQQKSIYPDDGNIIQ